ncbi:MULTISPECIES: TraE/TraK family type IV conjugative transfer system protein [Herbaspirillum]|uniref:TraE/TraK family type IV conjugative transfer system protein n=2 Tax=Herbaspirillum huttiense TaxID=863372 RepID=A0AAJ2H5B2_9BURK|nr:MULTISPECIES: TraE/TraK family type IV conjugative transfer system protein [Herbaspirillum]MDR9837052.1 TraE/TraK family type IV conjugative transfer system protein [Herbaspirillum huttiense]
MRLNLLAKSWRDSNKLLTINGFVSAVLAVALLLLVIDKLSDHERQTLVPLTLSGPVKVTWNSADMEYFEGFGLYIATLTANITPKNAVFVADRLSAHFSPEAYTQIRKQLYGLATDPTFVKNGGSVSFTPNKVYSEKTSKKVFVVGEMVSANSNGRNSHASVIEMEMTMEKGLPMVKSITNYAGTEPHTHEWIQKNPTKAQELKKLDLKRAAEMADETPTEPTTTEGAQQ